MNAMTDTAADHRELFPMGSLTGSTAMRRIGTANEVADCASEMWSKPAPASVGPTLEAWLRHHLRGSMRSHEALLAVYDYFEAYAPLSTDMRDMGRDARRALMARIGSDARTDVTKYRNRMKAAA